jgi:hypothetical protein
MSCPDKVMVVHFILHLGRHNVQLLFFFINQYCLVRSPWVIGMMLLLYFYPYLTIGILLLAGIAFQYYRRKSHAKLYPRRP